MSAIFYLFQSLIYIFLISVCNVCSYFISPAFLHFTFLTFYSINVFSLLFLSFFLSLPTSSASFLCLCFLFLSIYPHLFFPLYLFMSSWFFLYFSFLFYLFSPSLFYFPSLYLYLCLFITLLIIFSLALYFSSSSFLHSLFFSPSFLSIISYFPPSSSVDSFSTFSVPCLSLIYKTGTENGLCTDSCGGVSQSWQMVHAVFTELWEMASCTISQTYQFLLKLELYKRTA